MIWPRPLISNTMAIWVLENFEFLISNYELRTQFSATPLILPNRNLFTAKSGHDHATALEVFADVRRLMCLEDRNILLNRLPEKIDGVDHFSYQKTSEIAGMFQKTEGQSVISYTPENMKTPISFISTLAHELAHEIMETKPLQYGPENELQTDLLCIILGFGAIQAQAARQLGWSGYLSNETRMFALALFLELREIDASLSFDILDGNLKKKLKRGQKQLLHYRAEISALSKSILPP